MSALGRLIWNLSSVAACLAPFVYLLSPFTPSARCIIEKPNRTQLLAEGTRKQPEAPTATPLPSTIPNRVRVGVRVHINCNMRQIKCDPVRVGLGVA